MLLWPDAEDWPEGGEIDIMEIPKGDRTKAHFTVHWGEENTPGRGVREGDFTQWHTFAVEWTPDHIIGYLDGAEIYRNDDSDANPPRSMHFAMQQDIGPYGDDWIPARDASTPGRRARSRWTGCASTPPDPADPQHRGPRPKARPAMLPN